MGAALFCLFTDVPEDDGYPAFRLDASTDGLGDRMATTDKVSQRMSKIIKQIWNELHQAARGGYLSLRTRRLGELGCQMHGWTSCCP